MYPLKEFIKRIVPDKASSYIDLLFPIIKINMEEKTNRLVSKIGGFPDLPKEIEYPFHQEIPYTFLAQINLEEIHVEFDHGILPKKGIIYFFILVDNITYPITRKDYKVFYHEKLEGIKFFDQKKLSVSPTVFNEKTLTFSTEYRLPTFVSYPGLEAMDEGYYDYNEYDDILEDYVEEKPFSGSHMLGVPEERQGNVPFIWAYGNYNESLQKDYQKMLMNYKDSALEYVNLLQLCPEFDEINQRKFLGVLYFGIHQDDLKRKDFSKVKLVHQI